MQSRNHISPLSRIGRPKREEYFLCRRFGFDDEFITSFYGIKNWHPAPVAYWNLPSIEILECNIAWVTPACLVGRVKGFDWEHAEVAKMTNAVSQHWKQKNLHKVGRARVEEMNSQSLEIGLRV